VIITNGNSATTEVVIRHGHMACGIGAGAQGFNMANPRVGPLRGRFECAGGIDVDAGAIRNFQRLTGVPGTVMDLFDEELYRAHHDKAPPAGWREATPADIRAVFGRLDILFASYPCKGFSGLLPARAAETAKYQALNGLTKRGMHLSLEAYRDDPVAIVAFENVPRIATARGAKFLAEIDAIYRAYGYVVSEVEDSIHDCGVIGGLGQSRKRFLRLYRHPSKVPNFIYQPEKKRLRGVGEIIGKLPLPGDPAAGVMHRVPSLQWKTWVRLAFVPAGKDWRALNDLAVVDGVLRDFGISPDQQLRNGVLGVMGWDETAGVVVGNQRSPLHGRHSVADPRIESAHNEMLGVRRWEDTARVVAGASRPANGAHSVADPRPTQSNQTYAQYGVKPWSEPASTVSGQSGAGGGPHSVADPRIPGKPRFNNVFRIVPFDQPSPAVAGPGGPAGGLAVADPRSQTGFAGAGKYRVSQYEEPAGTVIAGSTTGQGAFAVADPRPTHGDGAHHNKMKVIAHDAPAPTITGSDRVGSGALSVADPRPAGLSDPSRAQHHSYNSQAHYGVVAWDETSLAVPGFAKYDRGKWSVADPREPDAEEIDALPQPNDRLVARIVARDGTWHRPFTTLELAALQSLFDPEEVFDLEGGSDAMKREWIGNAVPSLAAKGMAEEIGEAILLAKLGATFTLSSKAIWVSPYRMALAIDGHQLAHEWDCQA
jgi:site-specific DNA-cytosine methylase